MSQAPWNTAFIRPWRHHTVNCRHFQRWACAWQIIAGVIVSYRHDADIRALKQLANFIFLCGWPQYHFIHASHIYRQTISRTSWNNPREHHYYRSDNFCHDRYRHSCAGNVMKRCTFAFYIVALFDDISMTLPDSIRGLFTQGIGHLTHHYSHFSAQDAVCLFHSGLSSWPSRRIWAMSSYKC